MILTTSQAAEYLNVSVQTLLRLIQRKKLPAFKVMDRWRVDSELLDQWIREQEEQNVKRGSDGRDS